jgi:hypothetical protein
MAHMSMIGIERKIEGAFWSIRKYFGLQMGPTVSKT